MKRKLIIFIVLVVSICVLAIGCKNTIENTHKGQIIIDINSVQDFISIKEKLGKDYDQATFVLKNDLDFSDIKNFTAIGDSYDNSFRATFEGNGYKVSNLSIENGNGYYGLFGYTVNAKVKNLTVENNIIKVGLKEKDNFIGGIIAFGTENTLIENVTVESQVEIIMDYKTINGENDIKYEYSDNEYIGGIIGYNLGLLTLKNSNANFVVNNEHPEPSENGGASVPKVNIKNLFVGGAVGFARGNGSCNIMENIKTDVYFNLCGQKSNVGGIIGYSDNSKITNSTVKSDERFYLMSTLRGNIGGMAGTISNTEVDSANIDISNIKVIKTNSNIGGLIGYSDKNSIIKTVNIDVSYDIGIDMTYITLGGVVGDMRDTSLTNVSDVKGLILSGGNELNILSEKTEETRYIAGLVGKIFGKSELSFAKTNLKAYQGAVGLLVEDIVPANDNKEKEVYTPIINNENVLFLISNCIAPEKLAGISATRLRNNYGTAKINF